MPESPGADRNPQGSPERSPIALPDILGVICLAGFVVALTLGGFYISNAVGFWCLAAGLLVAGVIFSWDNSDKGSKGPEWTVIHPDQLKG